MNNGGPAFPRDNGVLEGMSLRDYFAAKAMASISSHKEGAEGLQYLAKRSGKEPDILLAEVAYSIADAMLKVREETS